MRRRIINIILILVAVAALVWCAAAKGLQWFIGFMVLVPACIGLLKLNSDYIENY